MTAPASIDDDVLMTLAGIAYGAPGSIAAYLQSAAKIAGDWSLAWLAVPADPPVNFAYMAKSARTGAYAVAIRGTYPNPFSPAYWDDGDQDSPFGPMADWPGGGGARISGGTATGLSNVLALTDARGATLQAAMAALPPGTTVVVTGHSLGGTLAPVLALKLAESSTHLALEATSFAGMTPGDSAFAALCGPAGPLGGRVRRVFNTLDTVAYGWDSVWATHDFYQPNPQGGPVVAAMLLATEARLQLGGYDYTAVGVPVPLTGAVKPVDVGCTLVAYILENLHQHMPDTYLALLGAPPLPFSILFGNVVTDKPAVRPLPPSAARLPLVYA